MNHLSASNIRPNQQFEVLTSASKACTPTPAASFEVADARRPSATESGWLSQISVWLSTLGPVEAAGLCWFGPGRSIATGPSHRTRRSRLRCMITFERARQIALESIGPTWVTDECSEYVVAGYGFQDDRAWCLVDGGSRLVFDGDCSCQLIGRGSTLVDKRTGEVTSLNYLEDPERFDAMIQVGQHPPGDSVG